MKSLNGEFDENNGWAEVELAPRLEAEQFYLALEKARSMCELKFDLRWETTQSDFKQLRDTLAITNVPQTYELHEYQSQDCSPSYHRTISHGT